MHGDVNNVRSARRRSTVIRSIEGRSSSFALFQTSCIWKFLSEVMLTLIMRRVLSRIVLLQESVIDRHHECISVWSYEAACSIWVDWLYYKWSFLFGFYFVLCVITMGLLTTKTRLPFLKIYFLTFLLKALEIRAWLSSICCWACRHLSSKAFNS